MREWMILLLRRAISVALVVRLHHVDSMQRMIGSKGEVYSKGHGCVRKGNPKSTAEHP